jgi:integrase
LGFYALRHTFRTWADEVRDQHAIHRIMGHAIPGMSGIYVERIELHRLREVVDHVRNKLFGKPDASVPDVGDTPTVT